MADKFWAGKRVTVTGANGFLASHLTLSLLKKKASVFGIVKERMPSSFLELSLKKSQHKNFRFLTGDISDYSFIKRSFNKYKPQICFHLAAQAIVGKANKSPIPTFKTNIEGTWNILDAAREFLPKCKIVVASSDKAYGEHTKLPYIENASLEALHPYDASKACTDILTRVYAHTYGLATAVTRCANIYGPGDLNFSRIVPDTVRSVLFKKDPVIRSDGTPLRDYIYVDDVVEGYFSLAKALYSKRKLSGEAFNFGSGRPISVIRLVNLIIKISGSKGLKPRILSKTKIKGEIDRQYLSSKKAQIALGWMPKYSFAEGLGRTLQWYRHRMRK